MKASDLTPSKYLKQSDVEPAVLVTIKSLDKIKFDERGQTKEKWAMSFRELDKPLLLNKTNINRLTKATGTDDVDEWTGKKVVLYFDPDVEFGGDIVGGIRVRAAKNQAAAEPTAPSRAQVDERMSTGTRGDPNDDIPFAPLHKRALWV